MHPNFTPECNYLTTSCMRNIPDLYSNTECADMPVLSTHFMSLLSISRLASIYHEEPVYSLCTLVSSPITWKHSTYKECKDSLKCVCVIEFIYY